MITTKLTIVKIYGNVGTICSIMMASQIQDGG